MSEIAHRTPVRFDTSLLPKRERVPYWRESFGRHVVGVTIDPLSDESFEAEARVRAWPGLRIMSFASAGAHIERSSDLVGDGDDAVALLVNRSGPMAAGQRGREVSLAADHATLLLHDEPSTVSHSHVRFDGLIVSRAALTPLVRHVEDAAARSIQPSPTLRLLLGYVRMVREDPALGGPELEHLIATHVQDLLAVVIGTTRDGAAMAAERGVRAARLAAIKSYIISQLGDPDLSVTALSARHHLTPRSIQMLFEREGTTFSQFVLEQRLTRVHRLLTDPRHAASTVSALALTAGFGDLSHFNRAFRRCYGATPSEVRAGARRLPG